MSVMMLNRKAATALPGRPSGTSTPSSLRRQSAIQTKATAPTKTDVKAVKVHEKPFAEKWEDAIGGKFGLGDALGPIGLTIGGEVQDLEVRAPCAWQLTHPTDM